MVTGEPFYNGDPRRKSVTLFFEKSVSLIDSRYIHLDLDRIISFSTSDAVKNKTLRDLSCLQLEADNVHFYDSDVRFMKDL